MYRVLVSDNLSDAGLRILEETPEIELELCSELSASNLREALKDADGIIIRSGTTLRPPLVKALW